MPNCYLSVGNAHWYKISIFVHKFNFDDKSILILQNPKVQFLAWKLNYFEWTQNWVLTQCVWWAAGSQKAWWLYLCSRKMCIQKNLRLLTKTHILHISLSSTLHSVLFLPRILEIFIRKKNLRDHKVYRFVSKPNQLLKCDHHRAVIEEPDYLP